MCSSQYFRRISVIVALAAISQTAHGQGLLPNGFPYFCAPPGICPDSGGIDPRIVTPDVAEVVEGADMQHLIDEVFFNRIITDGTPAPGVITCPAGKVPCYAQGPTSNCGQRLVPITNMADGNAQFGAYPWQAYLMGPTGAFLGSGSLLSPYHVLTAAHKVLAFVANPAQLTVVMGVNNPATMNNPPAAPRSTANQITIFNASTYNNATLKNDIAIVRLTNPISLVGQTSINTICLPAATATATTYAVPPQRCVVSGWGQLQPTNVAVPTQLKQVAVSTTNIATCAAGFAGKVNTAMYLDMTGGQICAGGEAQKDACFQDGGGPLTCGAGTAASRFTVAGVVIWGKSCGQPGVYGVYSNVPFYRAWIISVITQPIP